MASRIIVLYISFFLSVSLQAFAKNETSRFDLNEAIAKLQKQFQNVKEYPILILERDEIAWRVLQAKAFGEENEKRRLKVVAEYVKEKLGLEITESEAAQVDIYATTVNNSALAYPIYEGNIDSKVKFCMVYPPSANTNKRLSTERILQLNNADAYGDLSYDNLKYTMTRKESQLFSLYHELSHCLDPKFLREVSFGGGEDAHSTHQSEAFAESMALLLMAKDGYTGLSERRRVLRTIYSRKVGPYLAAHPELSFGNPSVLAGGIVYYLEGVLRYAHIYTERQSEELAKMGTEELIDVAVELTEKYAVSSRSFYPIRVFLEEGPDQILPRYRGEAFDWPEVFYQPYQELLSYIDYTDYILGIAFAPDEAAREVSESEELLSEINYQELCEYHEAGDRDSYLAKLSVYRGEIIEARSSIVAQRERAKYLDDLFLNTQSFCSSLKTLKL